MAWSARSMPFVLTPLRGCYARVLTTHGSRHGLHSVAPPGLGMLLPPRGRICRGYKATGPGGTIPPMRRTSAIAVLGLLSALAWGAHTCAAGFTDPAAPAVNGAA